MNTLVVDLDGTRPAGSHFQALLDELPGDWHVEAAMESWRGEQVADGMAVAIGLVRTAPRSPWMLSWRVDADVPDIVGVVVIALAIAVGTATLLVAASLDAGLWGPAASVLGVFGTLQLGKLIVTLRLPDTEGHSSQLGGHIRAAVTSLPGVTIVEPEGDP